MSGNFKVYKVDQEIVQDDIYEIDVNFLNWHVIVQQLSIHLAEFTQRGKLIALENNL